MAEAFSKRDSIPFAERAKWHVLSLLGKRKVRRARVESPVVPQEHDRLAEYERILKSELGEDLDIDDAAESTEPAEKWTDLEREDTEMLARMRNALYARD